MLYLASAFALGNQGGTPWLPIRSTRRPSPSI